MLTRREALTGLAVISAAFTTNIFSASERSVSRKLGHILGNPTYRLKSGSVQLPSDLVPSTQQAGKTYYVNPAASKPGNNGLSKDYPFRTIREALLMNDVGTIVCQGGQVYLYGQHGQEGLGLYSGNRSISIVSEGGYAVFATARRVGWKEIGPNLYESTDTKGPVVGVVDMARFTTKLDSELVRVNSEQECRLSNRTWFYDNGRVIASLEHRPNDSLILLQSFRQGISSPGVTLHCRGIHFIGGSDSAFSDKGAFGSTLIFERCRFSHSWRADGLRVQDSKLVISVDSDAFKNAKDGFNYHSGKLGAPHFLEIRCRGFGNKKQGTGNGSTAHDGCVGMRFDCTYSSNNGPGIADVGSKTWNVRCVSMDNGTNRNSFGIYVGGNGECWLDEVYASNKVGKGVYVESGSTLHAIKLESSILLGENAVVDSMMT